ncbi:glomulin [Ahaetulla prasina]|uniref:glomulin n=1 Tax=Ahaetulla prasina TaxID=499056 RepID=UPI002648461C|nr:glomulin [Ahaetulla prasina]
MAKELQEIIQRCQFLDEENFKGEDYNLFQVAGQKCFEEGNIAEVLEIVQNKKNVLNFFTLQVIIKNMGWSLIGPLLRCMLKQRQDDVERQYCMKILDKLVELCSAKELILGFLEQIEQASREETSSVILLLLKPLQEALLKLDTKKAYSVGLSLSTILSQLSLLPIPYTKQQLQEDQHGLCQCLNALAQFVRPFVLEIVHHVEILPGGNCNDLKEELLGFCLKSLKYPLLMAELDPLPEEMAENHLRQFAAAIVGILADMRELFPQVRFQPVCKRENWDDEDISEMNKEQSSDALACLSYIVFVQDCFGVDCLPVVFNPSYILQCNMVHIRALLKRTEEPVLSKGLALLENCLLRLENNSLFLQYLEFEGFITTPQDLVKIMTQCPFESLRKKSFKILQLYLDKFNEEGKYILFRCLLKTSNHSGVEGHIIQNIKNQIDLSLKREEGSKFFTGLQLVSLLDMVLSLPEGAETDLLQHSDRIMASLNLLRYLFIKDNEDDNKTCVWTELYKIERNFLKPLHTGLNMSRAHYEAEIKRKKENKRAEPHSSKKACFQLISKAKMSGITKDMELQALHSALFTFDLMESVLARVEELIENKGCN